MIPNRPTIGVRFDSQKVGGGYYGAACWTVFWEAIGPEELKGAAFYEGDTAATLAGKETVFCLAVQSADTSSIEKVRNALSKSPAFLKICASPMLVQGSACTSEPLVDAGRIDAAGNLVGNAAGGRSALGALKRRQEKASAGGKALDVPQRKKPASARTAGVTTFRSFADVVDWLEKNCLPKESEYSYWLTPEELCDIVEAAADVTEVQYTQGSSGISEDICCISLFQRSPPEGEPIEFRGLFAFASESDALRYFSKQGSPEYARALPDLAGLAGRSQINFEGSEGNTRDVTYDNEDHIKPLDLWPKLWARKQRLSA